MSGPDRHQTYLGGDMIYLRWKLQLDLPDRLLIFAFLFRPYAITQITQGEQGQHSSVPALCVFSRLASGSSMCVNLPQVMEKLRGGDKKVKSS